MSRPDPVSRVRSGRMADAARRIEYVPVEDVQSALRNPKLHDAELIATSIGRWGVIDIPTLDERTGRLVSGHGRRDELRRARAAGEPPPDGVIVDDDGAWLMPVVRGWSSIDDDDAHAAGVALNRSTEAGGWDDRELTEMLRDINEHDPFAGLTGTGYDPMTLANLVMVTRTANEIADFDAAAEWVGLPEYDPEERPWKLVIAFADNATREQFLDDFGVREHISFTHADARTMSAWYPVRDAPVHDTGLRWEDPDADPLGVGDPLPLVGVGPEGGPSEDPLDGRLSGSDGEALEPPDSPPTTALDPAHGPLTPATPATPVGEGEGAEAGEGPPHGSLTPASGDPSPVSA